MPDEIAPRPSGRRWSRRRILGGTATVVVVAAVFLFILPRIADYRDVWEVLRDEVGWAEALVLAAATVLNLVTFAPPWMVALPGLGFRPAFMLSQASTALSMVAPAGAAVGMAGSYGLLRSWGFGAAPVALAVALTGVWNQLANLTFPVVGLVLLTGVDQDHPALTTAAFVALGVLVGLMAAFVLALSSPRRARQIGNAVAHFSTRVKGWFRRPPVTWDGESLSRFRRNALGLLRRRWHVLTLATLVGHLTVFLLLLVCLRVVGVSETEISWIQAFAAWSLVRILGALPITPGGVGIVEVGLSGALVAFGASNADAVAATLLYRGLTVLPTLGLGMLAAATWRTHHPRDGLESPR
jgi:putative heme transporter